MNIKKERVLIVGCSGSGKDFLMRKLVEKGMKPALKWTTRPQRKFEKEGISYNFVNESKFIDTIDNNEFAFYQKFEVTPDNSDKEIWYYGVTNEDFKNSQVLIMTPGELLQLDYKIDKVDNCIIYLDIDRKTRESRLNKREDKNDSVIRRLDSDDEDFKEFSKSSMYDLRITDADFDADDIYELIF